MIRTQIQLSEAQARAVKRIARRDGISMAEVIRRGVDQLLEQEAPTRDDMWERAMAVVGQHEDRDGATDVAARHDRYLDEAFE